MARTQKSQPHQFGKSRPSGDGNFNMHVLTPQKTRDTHYVICRRQRASRPSSSILRTSFLQKTWPTSRSPEN